MPLVPRAAPVAMQQRLPIRLPAAFDSEAPVPEYHGPLNAERDIGRFARAAQALAAGGIRVSLQQAPATPHHLPALPGRGHMAQTGEEERLPGAQLLPI